MIRRRQRRSASVRGFALAEALVALAVGAMTLLLLAGASWGLRLAAERAVAPPDAAAQMLASRRVLRAWAASVAPSGGADPSARLAGDAEELRLALRDASGAPFVASLRVERSERADRLVARRDRGATDVRAMDESGPSTTLLEAPRGLRLTYLVPQDEGRATIWVYEIDPARATPAAIAVEIGGDRAIIADIAVTVAADCVVAGGLAEREAVRCRVR